MKILSNNLCQNSGAVASPTAGLHFNEDLMEDLKKRILK